MLDLITKDCRVKGLVMNRVSDVTGTTIEDELEKALYKSGGILESNYGDLQKVSWVRSSRTDKGVHSLSTVISMKMEVPLGAWTSDSDGISLVESVNSFLPSSIKVFGIVPVNKSFDARRSCFSRTYSYLLPTEILGIYKHTSVDVRRKRIQDFQAILCLFEGRYPFHNYTARSRYRHRSPRRFISASRLDKTCVVEEVLAKLNFSKREDNEQSLLETGFETTVADEFFTYKIEDFREILSCEEKIESVSCSEEMSDGGSHIDNRRPSDRKAWWVHEPDGVDKVGTAHFRKIYSCSCGQAEEYGDISYVQIFITGESFMLHQVRKIVGTAVAVLRGVLPLDIIQPSLSRHSRVILPLAPSEGLVLTKTQFLPFKRGHILSDRQQFDYMDIRLEMSSLVASKAEAFWQTVLLPRMLPLMDASKLPWTFWLETLESHGGIPAAEISELQIAWSSWKENNLLKKQQYHQDASS